MAINARPPKVEHPHRLIAQLFAAIRDGDRAAALALGARIRAIYAEQGVVG